MPCPLSYFLEGERERTLGTRLRAWHWLQVFPSLGIGGPGCMFSRAWPLLRVFSLVTSDTIHSLLTVSLCFSSEIFQETT